MTLELVRDDLFQQLLLSPLGDGADELQILAGYASASFAVFHMSEVRAQLGRDFRVRLHIGMTGADGIALSTHQSNIAAMHTESEGRLQIAYAPTGVSDHTKLYVWLQEGLPVRAWFGSANYSASAFGVQGERRESMIAVDENAAWITLRAAVAEFVRADAADVFSRVPIYDVVHPESRRMLQHARVFSEADALGRTSVALPLVQSTGNPGEVHNAGAGLNWGQRGTRRRAEAYIPVPATVARLGFFPDRGIPFAVLTDDGETLFLTVAQDGNKALHSVPDNATIGRWFRRRLGVADDAFVTTADLERYGSKLARVTALDDGTYFLSF